MDISERESMDPMEALISLVRTGMGRAAYVESVLSERMRKHIDDGGNPLDPPADMYALLKESRQERLIAARTAKTAVDAGVMTALARRVDLEGSLVADAVAAALDALSLDAEDRMRALGAAQSRLMSAE